MPWTVALRPRARADITQAADWFAEKSRTAEERWRKRLMKAITELETDPRRHTQADEAAALGMDLRK